MYCQTALHLVAQLVSPWAVELEARTSLVELYQKISFAVHGVVPGSTSHAGLPWLCLLQGAMRQQVDRTSREIKAAAEAAEAARLQAGAVTATAAQTAVVVGQKRGRTAQAAVAEAAAALHVRSEEDALMAKILTGELFAEKERQPQQNR